MQRTKVCIVEDESIVAMGIAQTLKTMGYEVPGVAANYTRALEMIERERPDILLIDIQLGGQKDGIDLAWKIKSDLNIPFIFLTANSDAATVQRAKKTEAHAFLSKPFRQEELYAAIELCLYNCAQKEHHTKEHDNYIINDSLFIKQGHYFHKVNIDDIFYIESQNIYICLYTKSGKLLVRNTLQDYLDIIASRHFYRVHRSYVVNVRHIQKLNTEFLVVNDTEIPIARAMRNELMAHLKLA